METIGIFVLTWLYGYLPGIAAIAVAFLLRYCFKKEIKYFRWEIIGLFLPGVIWMILLILRCHLHAKSMSNFCYENILSGWIWCVLFLIRTLVGAFLPKIPPRFAAKAVIVLSALAVTLLAVFMPCLPE